MQIAAESTTCDWCVGVRGNPEKPQHILIALQDSACAGNQIMNPSAFEHFLITQMHVMLNDILYPACDGFVDFDGMRYLEHY